MDLIGGTLMERCEVKIREFFMLKLRNHPKLFRQKSHNASDAAKMPPANYRKAHYRHHHPLNILMSKRLIGRPSVSNVIQRHLRRLVAWPALISPLRRSRTLTTPQWTLHPLILVWALLIPEPAPCWTVTISLDLVAPSAAAARAEEPEETRGEGEENTEPDRHVDAVAEGAVDVVFLQRIVEGARQSCVEDCGCEGEGDEEQGANS